MNSVLCNLYRDGEQSLGWHCDNESELGPNPIIVSISLGCSRKFKLRHIKTGREIEVELNNGTLLIMSGTTQQLWQHCIPQVEMNSHELKETTARINLSLGAIL